MQGWTPSRVEIWPVFEKNQVLNFNVFGTYAAEQFLPAISWWINCIPAYWFPCAGSSVYMQNREASWLTVPMSVVGPISSSLFQKWKRLSHLNISYWLCIPVLNVVASRYSLSSDGLWSHGVVAECCTDSWCSSVLEAIQHTMGSSTVSRVGLIGSLSDWWLGWWLGRCKKNRKAGDGEELWVWMAGRPQEMLPVAPL